MSDSAKVRDRRPTPAPSPATSSVELALAQEGYVSGGLIEDALRPDPGCERDYCVPDYKFAFSIGQLNKLLNPKSLPAFVALGGLEGLEKGLKTNRTTGLDVRGQQSGHDISFGEATRHVVEDLGVTAQSFNTTDASCQPFKPWEQHPKAFADRCKRFGDGSLPIPTTRKPWMFVWELCKLESFVFLCALASLIVSLYQDLRLKPATSRLQGLWKQDAAIMVLLLLTVLLVSSISWFIERAEILHKHTIFKSRGAIVVRSGKFHEVLWNDVFVGDLVFIQPGDHVFADGIVVRSAGLCCDESLATGESDPLWKDAGDSVYTRLKQNQLYERHKKADPFIVSGAKVVNGVGTFLVTSTGINSSYGKVLISLREEEESVNHPSDAMWIKDALWTVTILLFLVLFIKFLTKIRRASATSFDTALYFLQMTQYCLLVPMLGITHWMPWLVRYSRIWWKSYTVPWVATGRITIPQTLSKVSTICIELDALLNHEACEVTEIYAANMSYTGFETINLVEIVDISREHEQPGVGSSGDVLLMAARDSAKMLWKSAISATSYAQEALLDGKTVVRGVTSLEKGILRFAKNKLGCDFAHATQPEFDRTFLRTTGSWYAAAAIVRHAPGYSRAYFMGIHS